MSKNEEITGFRKHVHKWKDSYQVLGLVVAMTVSTTALVQSIAGFRLQTREFHIRNRPYVILLKPQMAGQAIDTARNSYPHNISIEMRNISKIPASEIKTVAEVFVNGARMWGTVVTTTALTDIDPKTMQVFLTEAMFNQITNSANRTRVVCKMTYSGILGENPGQYETDTDFEYFVEDGTLRPEKIIFK